MLENMRRQGASIFIYVIFGILIAVFIINFRPGQTRNDDSGCTGTTNTAVSVDGSTVNLTSYKVNYGALQGPSKGRVHAALENLIRRELLANAATEHGIRGSDDLILNEIKKGWFFLGGRRESLKGVVFREDGTWDYNRYKGWVQNSFNVSLNSYQDEQQREMQASLMADLLAQSVRVSREEALSDYLFQNNTVTFDTVTFKPDAYPAAAMKLTDADVDRFVDTHADEIKARYDQDIATYKGVKPQLKLREIFIAKPEAPKPEEKKPDDPKQDEQKKDEPKKADDQKKAEPPKGMTTDEAKAKLEAVRTDGAKKFADHARELDAEPLKGTGGDLGWRTADNASIGEKAVTDAVKTLKPGEMTPVIATDKGVYLVLAEDKREGDLTLDQVKREIGTTLAKDVWSKEAAKRDALAALDNATTNKKKLDQIFQRDTSRPNEDDQLMKILQDPKIPDKVKQELLEQFQRRKSQGGMLEIESKDHPAGWFADSGGTSGGSSSGSSAGSSAPAPAPTPAPAPKATEIKASADKLPEFPGVELPKVQEKGPSPRVEKIAGITNGKDIATALFDELSPGDVGKRVYEADGAYVVIQLKARNIPKVEDFDKSGDNDVAEMRARRQAIVVNDWLRDHCEAALKAGKIIINPDLLSERDDKGNAVPTTYQPCFSLHGAGDVPE